MDFRQGDLYDFASDEAHIARAYAAAEELREFRSAAIDFAFRSHPVSLFVLRSEAEDFYKHPAISEKRLFCPQGGGSLLDGPCDGYVDWSLPGHDPGVPARMGCGFVRSDRSDLPVTACVENKDHYAKAKRSHCWMMSCPLCFNDACLRGGARIEKRLVAYADISRRKGFAVPRLKHWQLSPPQRMAVASCLTVSGFTRLSSDAIGVMKEYGMTGGLSVFHPFRLQKSESWDPSREGSPYCNWVWRVGPHFHFIGYGFLDTERFREDHGWSDPGSDASETGWVLKQIHPREEIRSVRQTVGYLLTHAGIGRAERPFPVVSAYRRGKVKKGVSAVPAPSSGGASPRVPVLDPVRARAMASLADAMSGSVSGFPSGSGPSREDLFSRRAESRALDSAVFDSIVPDRSFNICSYELVSGARYRFVACMNEYLGADYSVPSSDPPGDPDLPSDFSVRESPLGFVDYYAEHLGEMDWERLARRVYTRSFQASRFFGALRPSELRVVGVHSDRVPRSCPECGGAMGVFRGCVCGTYEPVEYRRDLKIFARASDASFVRELYEDHREALDAEGKTFLDFSLMIPHASSAVSCGLEPRPAPPRGGPPPSRPER
jgi:hypothetical protein